jgi:MFS family permease
MLANVVGIVASGRRTDRGGPLDAFAGGLVLFGLGLVGGGVAPSMAALVAARAVQGLGAGGLSAVVYACVARCYPTDRQPHMLALLSTAWVVPGLVGPGLSGLVADHATWRLVFLGLVPILPVCAALALPALRRLERPRVEPAADPAGRALAHAAVLATGGVLVLLALEARTLVTAALGVLGVAAAGPSLRHLMPPGTLRARPGLPAAIASMALVCVAFFGAEVLLPLFMTVFRGQPATLAGLALSGATLTWTAGAWIQSRQARRGTRRALVGAGAGLMACGMAIAAAVVSEGTPLLAAALGWAVVGLGMGVAHTTISLTVIEQARAGEEGAAAAAMQLASVLGVAAGAGIGGAAVAFGATHGWRPATGFLLAFALLEVAAVGTLALSRRLPGVRNAGG